MERVVRKEREHRDRDDTTLSCITPCLHTVCRMG